MMYDKVKAEVQCAVAAMRQRAITGRAGGTLGLLCRLLPLLRAAFPRARFLVRLDGGFATPEIFDFLDAEPRLDYVVAMAKNAMLQRHAESAMQVARAQSEVGGETAHVYTDTRYAARTWDHERRARAPDSPPVAPRPPASWAAWAAPPAGLSLPNPRVRHDPPVGCSTPAPLAGDDVRDSFLRRSRPLAVESGPS